jgi:hypothetical protein
VVTFAIVNVLEQNWVVYNQGQPMQKKVVDAESQE